jgi:hypothetical protein
VDSTKVVGPPARTGTLATLKKNGSNSDDSVTGQNCFLVLLNLESCLCYKEESFYFPLVFGKPTSRKIFLGLSFFLQVFTP